MANPIHSGTRPTRDADGKKKRKKHVVGRRGLGFLDLPGEIRNQIYAYCFEEEVWIDMTPKANHIKTQDKLHTRTWASAELATGADTNHHQAPAEPGIIRVIRIVEPGDSSKYKSRHGKPHKIAYCPATRAGPLRPTKWPTSAGALVRTSRQVHAEALPLFYATVTFSFSGQNALLRFLKLLPAPKLALIRKLHVEHATYGDPMLSADVMWKERHERSWARAMTEAARVLTGLELLRCRIVVNDRPLLFTLEAPWARALVIAWSAACQLEQTSGGMGGKLRPLQTEIAVQSPCVSKGVQMPRASLKTAHIELHQLFAEALRRRLHGWGPEDATFEFRLAKLDKYKQLTEEYPMP